MERTALIVAAGVLLGMSGGAAPAAAVTAQAPATAAIPAAPHGTASNGKIVFRRWLNGTHTRGEIFTINSDGSGLSQVTHTPGAASTEPDPSPDGRWIDYMVIRNGDLSSGRLFKIRPDGSDRTGLSRSCTRLLLLSTGRWPGAGRVRAQVWSGADRVRAQLTAPCWPLSMLGVLTLGGCAD